MDSHPNVKFFVKLFVLKTEAVARQRLCVYVCVCVWCICVCMVCVCVWCVCVCVCVWCEETQTDR